MKKRHITFFAFLMNLMSCVTYKDTQLFVGRYIHIDEITNYVSILELIIDSSGAQYFKVNDLINGTWQLKRGKIILNSFYKKKDDLKNIFVREYVDKTTDTITFKVDSNSCANGPVFIKLYKGTDSVNLCLVVRPGLKINYICVKQVKPGDFDNIEYLGYFYQKKDPNSNVFIIQNCELLFSPIHDNTKLIIKRKGNDIHLKMIYKAINDDREKLKDIITLIFTGELFETAECLCVGKSNRIKKIICNVSSVYEVLKDMSKKNLKYKYLYTKKRKHL